MTRIALYLRYSSEEQSEGWSLEAQERGCRSFVDSKPGWAITAIYTDEARSGKSTDRPGFQDMLKAAHAGEFDALVCHKLDRFSRNLVDVLLTLDDLQKHDVAFASATEPIDFTTPLGKVVLIILAFFAEWYLQNLSAETTKGKRERFQAGLWNGDLRYGYIRSDDGKPQLVDDSRHVLTAYQLCAAGKSDQQVADAMNTDGARTLRLRSNSKKKATYDTPIDERRPWTKDSVGALFTPEAAAFYSGHTTYIGEGERKKRKRDRRMEILRDTHPAVIDDELARTALAARAKRRNPGRLATAPLKHDYIFGERVAVCSVCGKPLRAWQSTTGKRAYYRCAAAQRGEACAAPARPVAEDVLVEAMNDYIADLELPDDWREAIREVNAQDDARAQALEARERLAAQLRRINYQINAGMVLDDDLPAMERRARALKEQVENMVIPAPARTVEAGERMVRLRQIWPTASKYIRREIVQAICAAVVVDTERRRIAGIKPHPEFVLLFERTRLRREGDVWRI
jgi:DNA invertase Pin-like site-specific DNA recombinase